MIEIKGKFKVIIYHNETSFFTVAKFALYEVEEKLITVTGTFKELQYDMLYRLEGEYIDYETNNYQYGSSASNVYFIFDCGSVHV